MAKSSGSRGKGGGNSDKNTFDKIAKAAMSREMLAAGLTAAAAAIHAPTGISIGQGPQPMEPRPLHLA